MSSFSLHCVQIPSQIPTRRLYWICQIVQGTYASVVWMLHWWRHEQILTQIVVFMDVRCIRYVLVSPLMFTYSMLILWYWMRFIQLHLHWYLHIQCYKKCSHFVWLDDEMNHIAKELISALLNNINKENVNVKSYKAKEEELKMLKKQLKINWILVFVMLFAFVGTSLMK